MKKLNANIIFGVLLVALGALVLLRNLEIIRELGELVWATIFGVGGASFLYVYVVDRERWWALIPGFSLLGIALILLFSGLAPSLVDVVAVPAFLGGIGLAFWLVYFQKRENWWAIIPGGVMVSLAIFIFLEAVFENVDLVGVFFLGMAGTFVLVALQATEKERYTWAYIPAGILGLMGAIFLFAEVDAFRMVGPIILVLVGAYLIFRTMRGREIS